MISGWGQHSIGGASRRLAVEVREQDALDNLVGAPAAVPLPPAPPTAKITREKPTAVPATAAVAASPASESTPMPAKSPRNPKDPNAPKRPPGAFFLYAREARPQVQAENPGMPVPEINKILGQRWEKENRQLWEQKNAQLLQNYQQELEMYERKKPVPADNDATLSSSNSGAASKEKQVKVSSDPAGDAAPVRSQNSETSQGKKRKGSKRDQLAGAKGEERMLTSTPSGNGDGALAQTAGRAQNDDGLKGRSKSPVAESNASSPTEIAAASQKKRRKSAVRALSMSPLGSEPNFLEEKGPILTMSHCNTLSSSQLLFGLPSSSQQSTSGLDLSQSLTAVAGVETTPEILKLKRKKKRNRPAETAGDSNGHEAALISREN